MLTAAKHAILGGLEATGVFHFVGGSGWRKQRLLVLCYHGVSLRGDEHLWNPYMFISPEAFEGRLRILAMEGYTVLPLREGLERLRKSSLPRKSIAITFDDGFANFYFQAWPILKKFNFPSTVYLTTYYVSFNRPVFNLSVPYMLWLSRGRRVDANARFGWTAEPDLGAEEGRERAWSSIYSIAEAQRLPARARDELAAEVAAHLNFDYGAMVRERALGLMTPEETRRISRNDVSIELHTHRHRTPHDPVLFHREIDENRSRIIEITGIRPDHFCYPSGLHRPDMLPLLEKAGVQSATTCDLGLVQASTNPLLTPRFVDRETLPGVVFKSWLTGTAALLPGRS